MDITENYFKDFRKTFQSVSLSERDNPFQEDVESNYTANKHGIRRTNTDAYYRRTTAYFVISHKGHRNYSEHGI